MTTLKKSTKTPDTTCTSPVSYSTLLYVVVLTLLSQYNVHNVDYNRAKPGHHLHMSADVPHPPRHALPAVVLHVHHNNTQRFSVQRPPWKPAPSLESLRRAQVCAGTHTERGASKRRIE